MKIRIFLASVGLLAVSAWSATLTPEKLRCEYRTNPAGIAVAKPHLGWILTPASSSARGVSQSAYQILVASTSEQLRADKGDLWDSTKVASAESAHVPYGGKPVASGASVWWKVRVWDRAGAASAWSEPASWSAGLQPRDWKARWIGLNEKSAPKDRVLPARILRKEIELKSQPKRAVAYLSGVGSSEFYVNGGKVSDDVLSPGLTDYNKRVLYVTRDITERLTAGKNALGLILGNGRFFGPRGGDEDMTTTYGYPKAILQLQVEYADGSKERILSDGSWKLTTNGPIRANNEYDGEEYDARMELNGWARPGFDDSAWQQAELVQLPPGVLEAQMAEPLRVTETLKPLTVKPGPDGAFIFDMGQNLVGWCRLKVSGPAGTRIQLRHAETLQPDGSLYIANLRSAKATDVYTLKGGGTETWEPRFTYHGFRFVEVKGYPGTPGLDVLEGRVVHDDMAKTADFESSNDLLNRIHHNIFWGVRGNYRSIPTDCPQRDERQGWLGDRSQVSRTETYLFDVAAFYTKWIQDLSDAQWPNGAIPDVVPTYWTIYSDNMTWPGTFVFLPGLLYDYYGDRRPIEKYYPALKLWLEHMGGYVNDEGLLTKDTYADWCVPPESPKMILSEDPARKTDGTFISTAYYAELLKLMARYARLLDRPDEAAAFDAHAAEVAKAFVKKYYKSETGIFANGTQTTSLLALAFDLAPKESRPTILAALNKKIAGENNHIGVGLVGAQWLMRTLSDNGLSDVAYTIATQKTYPGWGYMVEQGATTVWELWNGDTADPAMNSGNHVMQIGDLGTWMYEYLAGIRPDPKQPGFKHILIKPYLAGDLKFAKASHQTMYGKVSSRWERTGEGLKLDVEIPANTTATIYVPAKSAAAVRESGKSPAAANGVKFLRTEGAAAVYEVGSGSYSFVSVSPR